MLISMAERQLHNDRMEAVEFDADTLTIEHLMPQGWRQEDWPILAADPKGRDQERADREREMHTLGNLTLITEELNGDLGNRPWPRSSRSSPRSATCV